MTDTLDLVARRYALALQTRPLLTKSMTSATLSFLGEFIATAVSEKRVGAKDGSVSLQRYVTSRMPKMALYGFFVSAPISHYLVALSQRIFRGRTSALDKFLQILLHNATIAPISNIAYLSCMAIIAGARTFKQVKDTVKAGLPQALKLAWLTQPPALLFCQNFLPPQYWVPFFNLLLFIVGTYINTANKIRRRELERANESKEE